MPRGKGSRRLIRDNMKGRATGKPVNHSRRAWQGPSLQGFRAYSKVSFAKPLSIRPTGTITSSGEISGFAFDDVFGRLTLIIS